MIAVSRVAKAFGATAGGIGRDLMRALFIREALVVAR